MVLKMMTLSEHSPCNHAQEANPRFENKVVQDIEEGSPSLETVKKKGLRPTRQDGDFDDMWAIKITHVAVFTTAFQGGVRSD